MKKVNIQQIAYKAEKSLKKNSPTILSCVAAVGVVASTVLAVKATPKALRAIENATDEKGEELTKLETVKVTAQLYIPTAITCVSTIVCILGANALNRKQQASLISAYALLDDTFKKYRKAAVDVYGEDADAKIKAEMANDSYISCDGWHIYNPDYDKDSEKLLFYDFYSQRFFNATYGQVVNAEYHINRNLQLRGDVSVNEFYEFLGIDSIDGGDNIGWRMDDLIEGGLIWLDFDNRFTKMEGGMECYIISSAWLPEIMYPFE